jgi:hypothetical protein
MNRSIVVALISSFVVLGACAHNAAVTTPVAVTINSQNAGHRFVRDVRNATLSDISKTVPGARPMTVSADLDVTTETLASGFNNVGTWQHAVPVVSATPYNEPSVPTVPDRGVSFPQTMIVVTEVNVSYTIKDSSGKIVESDHVRFSVGSPGTFAADDSLVRQERDQPVMTFFEPFPNDRMMVRDAAAFLASRVKALSH